MEDEEKEEIHQDAPRRRLPHLAPHLLACFHFKEEAAALCYVSTLWQPRLCVAEGKGGLHLQRRALNGRRGSYNWVMETALIWVIIDPNVFFALVPNMAAG